MLLRSHEYWHLDVDIAHQFLFDPAQHLNALKNEPKCLVFLEERTLISMLL